MSYWVFPSELLKDLMTCDRYLDGDFLYRYYNTWKNDILDRYGVVSGIETFSSLPKNLFLGVHISDSVAGITRMCRSIISTRISG